MRIYICTYTRVHSCRLTVGLRANINVVSEPDPSCGGGGKGLGTILHSSCPQVGMLT